MSKIKGLHKLNKSISAQLKPFGIKEAVCTDEYSYIFKNETVTFKLTEGTTEDIWFKEFIKERFDYNVKYPFVFSLLHEVGHHKTDEDINANIYNFCMDEKARIDEEMIKADATRSKELEWQYFNLPDEILATAWAVKYCRKHPKKVRKMNKKMMKALCNFYDKNGVED